MNIKAVAFVSTLAILLVVAVMGIHWTDTAKTKFWWDFWPIASVVSIISFIGLIIWFSTTRKKW